VAPYVDQLSAVRAVFIVLLSLPRARRREVWIGDSHAAAMVVGPTWAELLSGPRGEIVIRVGARLMYSLATRGFPARVTRFAALVARCGRRDSFAPLFVAGEIDVRNALAARQPVDFTFVGRYVDAAVDVADRMKASTAYIVVPPPPRPLVDIDPSFPTAGTDEQRLSAFGGLRRALHDATRGRDRVVLIDLTDQLAGPDGWMRPEYTRDGCHTYFPAHPVIRNALRADPRVRTGQS
jgi:hypothetical protein